MGEDERRTQRFQEVDFNVNKGQMKEMLRAAARDGSRPVRELAKHILEVGVSRVTGAHAGGFGGGGRGPDPNQHCTVQDKDRDNYHVYLGQRSGRWYILNITG